MRIGIIGSGNIGGTAARLFTRAGHEVALSHAGGPESLKGLVAQLGPNARAATVEDAADFGDVVLLAIPWRDRDDLPSEQLAGKIVIDATNPYAPDFSVYDLGDSTSSEEVAKDAPGARLVKAFNTMRATDLATLGRPDRPRDQRPVLFLAGDDVRAKQVVAALIEQLGFAPFDTGSLHEGGRRQQPGSPVYGQIMREREAQEALGGLEGVAGKPAGTEGRTMRVEELMKPAECCKLGATVRDVAKLMKERNIGFVPVCDDEGRPVGTITDRDLAIRVLAERRSADEKIEAVMTKDVVSCKIGDDLRAAEQAMRDHHKSRIVLVDDQGKVKGVISLSDIVEVEEEGEAARTLRVVASRETQQPNAS